MKLTELEPRFIQRVVGDVDPAVFVDGVMHPDGKRTLLHTVEKIEDAHGLYFICPKCHAGPRHSVICWFEGKVADEVQPAPGRWNPQGTGFADLSFVPGAKTRSIQLIGGCNAHFFITNGEVHE